jgi:iron complex outermembrane receptor protein
VLGGNPTLQAQTATTWSFGTDIKPTSVPGLSISATYYNVLFKKQIGLVPFTNPSVAFASYYSNYVMVNPTPAQIQSIASQVQSILGPFLAGFPNTVAGLLAAAAANPPYAIIDTRKANLGQLKVNGIDFNARYAMPTSFGEVNFGAAGTYTLSRQFAPAAGASFVDQFVNPGSSRLYASLFVGAKAGAFDASLVLNHSDGYSIPANNYVSNGFVASGTQTSVAAFNVLDLSLAYALSGGPLDNTQLSLTINNVLKASPPFDSTNVDAGYGNGATLGRLVQLGVTKKF